MIELNSDGRIRLTGSHELVAKVSQIQSIVSAIKNDPSKAIGLTVTNANRTAIIEAFETYIIESHKKLKTYVNRD